MKKIGKEVLALILVFVLFGCNEGGTEADQDGKSNPIESNTINKNWKTLILPEVSIEYPKNWTLDTSKVNQTLFILVSQKTDSSDEFSATLNLFSEFVDDATLSEYVDASEKQIQAFMKGSLLRQSKDTLIQGKAFHQVQFVAESADGLKLIFDQLYHVQNKKAYVLTYNCEAEEYEKMKPMANRVIRSMKLN